MKIEPSETSGHILIDCMKCGSMFDVPDFRNGDFSEIMNKAYQTSRYCHACSEEEKHEREKREEEQRRAEYAARVPELIAKAGIPKNYVHDRENGKLFSAPPVRFAAEWIWKHRECNLLISGITGSGKSTSACFVAAKMISEGKRVRYTSLRKLLADWREAKTSEQSYAPEKLLAGIFHQDYFLIDEVAGKARITDSGQELLFELLESVNNGECYAKLWLLGNFYSGSIEDIFSDPEPARRRLQENFLCAVIDHKTALVTPIKVWNE